MIRGIHHVAVHVHDLDRMIKFYQDAFDFELVLKPRTWRDNPLMDQAIGVEGSAARSAMLRAGTCYLELFQFSAPSPNSTRPLRPYDKGYTHFCVDVTDIAKECARLQGLGMSFGGRPPTDFGVAQAIYGLDPEGNIIELQECGEATGIGLDRLPPIAS
jgi:catechol 2,3-dioxygenase-like lactoylglutathione lyase family enzyme